jgi:hypothetical protein
MRLALALLHMPCARSDRWASSFDEDGVAPASVVPGDALADADVAEPGGVVEGQAGGGLGKDAGLDGPDARGLGGGDVGVQQRQDRSPAYLISPSPATLPPGSGSATIV